MMVLPGKFDVTLQGAATFSIPISVPPGTGGMVPSLSLDYTSGGGNGLVGVGWGVDGLPAITRCPQTYAQDNHHGNITYDVGITAGQSDNDRFCLNGQRLVTISGNYGADGTEYRTELESFSRIVSHGYSGGSPAYFDVYTKSGQIIELGNTSDSRVKFANISGFPAARSWLVDKISDTLGNYITVKYTVDPDSNVSNYSEVVPTEIDYTGNSVTGLVPYNKVTFIYANGTRPDIAPLYEDGNLVETTQLLTNIKTWSGAQSSPGSTEVTDYKLAYTTSSSTGRELLTSVSMCDGADSNCLPARAFGYQPSSSPAFTFHQQSSGLGTYPNPPSNAWSEVEGDFAGNGKVDFAFIQNSTLNVYLSNGDGSFTMHSQGLSSSFGAPPESSNPFANGVEFPPTSPYFFVDGDFNGDGRSDFALIDPGVVKSVKGPPGQPPTFVDEPGSINVFLSNGDGTFKELLSQSFSYIAPSVLSIEAAPGDFTGDGKTSFAILSGNMIYAFLSKGDGTFTEHTPQNISPLNFGSMPSSTWSLASGDFNGNGETDFALITGTASGNQIYTFLSAGDGTFNVVSQLPSGALGSPPTVNWIPITGDFTGDGLTDIAFLGTSSIYTLLSKGDGTYLPSTQNISENFGSMPGQSWTPIEGDFTGGGLTDFALISNNAMYTFLSNRNGTFAAHYQQLNASYGSPPAAHWTPVVGDFNGDGLSDFGFLTGSVLNTEFSTGPDPDLLTNITNGIGAKTSVNYGTPAEGSGLYYAGWTSRNTNGCQVNRTNHNYPGTSIDVTPAKPVVTSTYSTTGISNNGSSYGSNYAYACALVDTLGRGFLGFSEEISQDVQENTQQTTDFLQQYPYVGLVQAQSKTVGVNGTSITLDFKNEFYNALTSTSSPALPWKGTQAGEVAPQFPYLAKSVESSNDLNGATLPTVTTTYSYDPYGNPLTVTTSKVLGTTQGPTQTTTNTYQPPNTTAPHWILGRLMQSQVVSTTP